MNCGHRNFLFVLLILIVRSNDAALSDKRLCGDEKCQSVISTGITTLTYRGGEAGMVSFRINSNIKVKSKSAGSNPSLWGVEVNGQRGYAPREFIKEVKVFIKDHDLNFTVPVEMSEASKATAPSPPPVLNSSEGNYVDLTTTSPLESQKLEIVTGAENVVKDDHPEQITPVQNNLIIDGTEIPSGIDAHANEIVTSNENKDDLTHIDEEIDDDDEDEDEDDLGDYEDDDSAESAQKSLESIEIHDVENKANVNNDIKPDQTTKSEPTVNGGDSIVDITKDNVNVGTEFVPAMASESTRSSSNENNKETIDSANVRQTASAEKINDKQEHNDSISNTNNINDVLNTSAATVEEVKTDIAGEAEQNLAMSINSDVNKEVENNLLKKEIKTDLKGVILSSNTETNDDNKLKKVNSNQNNIKETAENNEVGDEKQIKETSVQNLSEPVQPISSSEKQTSKEDSEFMQYTNVTVQSSNAPASSESIEPSGVPIKEPLAESTASISSEKPVVVQVPTKLLTHPEVSISSTQSAESLQHVTIEKESAKVSEEYTESASKTAEFVNVPTQTLTQPESQPLFGNFHNTESSEQILDGIAPFSPASEVSITEPVPAVEVPVTESGPPVEVPVAESVPLAEVLVTDSVPPVEVSVTESVPPVAVLGTESVPPVELPKNSESIAHDEIENKLEVAILNNNVPQVAIPNNNLPFHNGQANTHENHEHHNADYENKEMLQKIVETETTVVPDMIENQHYPLDESRLDETTTPIPQIIENTLPFLHGPIEVEEKRDKGLFATMLSTVKGLLPSNKKDYNQNQHLDNIQDEELKRILYPEQSKTGDEQFCEKLSPNNCPSFYEQQQNLRESNKCLCDLANLNWDNYGNIFAGKVLEMGELLAYLTITAASILLFIFGYYCFCNSSREGALLSKLNLLERSLLATQKENAILKHDLLQSRSKLSSIEDNSFGSNDMVIALKNELQEIKVEKEKLEEQVGNLEKELVTAADAGLELNKIVSDMLSTQTGDESMIINSVEELQRQLNEQQNTIFEINSNLAEKSRENSELRLMIAEQNARLCGEIASLQQDNDELESEKSNLLTRLEEIKTEFDDDISKALEGKNFELKRLQGLISELQTKLEAEHTKWQTSVAKIEALEDCLKSLKKDPHVNIKDVIDVANVRAEVLDLQKQSTGLKERLDAEIDARKLAENQLKISSDDVEKLKQTFHQSEKDKLEAQTRLEVLSNYFKEKETQLQKELSVKEAMWLKQQGETTSTVDRLTAMQEEIQSLKSQNDALRAEIEAQMAAHKAQTGTLENRAHETWLAARQLERRYEEARTEATALRRKLTTLSSANTNDINRIPSSDVKSNNDLNTAPSPIHLESPSSPLLGRMPPPPPFLPPPFMGPPPPFMGMPPPFVQPGDIRPLGRLISPPPPLHDNGRYGRFTPPGYDDDDDDDEEYVRRSHRRGHWHRDTHSPPRSYRSYSPADSRYNYTTDRDLISTYDTETDFSPPPSPRNTRERRQPAGNSYGHQKQQQQQHPTSSSPLSDNDRDTKKSKSNTSTKSKDFANLSRIKHYTSCSSAESINEYSGVSKGGLSSGSEKSSFSGRNRNKKKGGAGGKSLV